MIQSCCTSKKQTSLHLVIATFKTGGNLHKKSYFFTSPSLEHNVQFVRSVQMMKELSKEMSKIEHITYGCKGQYKNKTMLYSLSRHEDSNEKPHGCSTPPRTAKGLMMELGALQNERFAMNR